MSPPHTQCMGFQTTLKLMLVRDGYSESCHMTKVVMLSLPFPGKRTLPIQYCLINTVIWLRTQEKYIHRETLYTSVPFLFAYAYTII